MWEQKTNKKECLGQENMVLFLLMLPFFYPNKLPLELRSISAEDQGKTERMFQDNESKN